MINSTELLIGNWVNYLGTPTQLLTGKQIDDNHKVINPIPITPEILEQLGFKKVHTELEPVSFNYSLEIPVDGVNKNEIHFTVVKMGNSDSWGNYLVNDHWASNNFKYLHQLQNLYFSLTGEELTVNFKELTYL